MNKILSFFLGAATVLAVSFQMPTTSTSILTPDQQEFLNAITMEDLDDGTGGTNRTARLSGLNFQIVNGQGATDTVNGVGNLFIGYREINVDDLDLGSHSVILGINHSIDNESDLSYGNIISGENHTITNARASIINGRGNVIVDGAESVVFGTNNVSDQVTSCTILGGQVQSIMSTANTVIVGGEVNSIIGASRSVIIGGASNVIQNGSDRCVSVGGFDNEIIGIQCVSVGGAFNTAMGNSSVLVGGSENTTAALATFGVLSGGFQRQVTGVNDWVSGSLFEDN